MDTRSRIYRPHGIYEPRKYQLRQHKKILYIQLSHEDITALITLLEMAESEISRITKRFGHDDYDLKDIYWYYRIRSREIRKILREQRGY
jgi:hypothetical protein